MAIPSKGRPAAVKSLELVASAVLFVPENERSAYASLNRARVVGVPNSVRGITPTRNWILNHVDDPRVVFIDDDLKSAGWTELQPFKAKRRSLTESQLLAEWWRLFDLAEELRLRLWGVATQSAPRAVYPYKPFQFYGYVTASCLGMFNRPDFRFDENFPVKEDYELCLRCIKEDGGVLAARYLYWENAHWTGEGGCKDYRTQDMERAAIDRLAAMYPGMIRRITRGGSEYSIELSF